MAKGSEQLTAANVLALIDAAKAPTYAAKYPFMSAYLALALTTAGRPFELLGLIWRNIDFVENSVLVASRYGHRRFSIPSNAAQVLRAWGEVPQKGRGGMAPHCYACGGALRMEAFPVLHAGSYAPLSVDLLKRALSTLSENTAGLPCNPHLLRRFVGNQWAMRGIDARVIDHYLGLETEREALQALPVPRLEPLPFPPQFN